DAKAVLIDNQLEESGLAVLDALTRFVSVADLGAVEATLHAFEKLTHRASSAFSATVGFTNHQRDDDVHESVGIDFRRPTDGPERKGRRHDELVVDVTVL